MFCCVAPIVPAPFTSSLFALALGITAALLALPQFSPSRQILPSQDLTINLSDFIALHKSRKGCLAVEALELFAFKSIRHYYNIGENYYN